MASRIHRWAVVCAASTTWLSACGNGGSNTGNAGGASSGGGANVGGSHPGTGGSSGATAGSGGSGASAGSINASGGAGGASGGAGGASGGAGGASGGAGGASGGAGGASGGASGGAGGAPALTQRRVFVSSKTYVPTFGSLEAADAECQKLADAQRLGGTWRAWLSDSNASPSSRFVQSAVPYVLVGGAQIAADWSDLVDGSIAVPIDHDETGAPLDATATTMVWTGTGTDGASSLGNCTDWSITASGAGYGSTQATDKNWTIESGNPCSNVDRLYCFEQ